MESCRNSASPKQHGFSGSVTTPSGAGPRTEVLTPVKDDAGRLAVDGLELAQLARDQAQLPDDPAKVGRSARNRFVGLVTDITADTVMAQVELQCGPVPRGVADEQRGRPGTGPGARLGRDRRRQGHHGDHRNAPRQGRHMRPAAGSPRCWPPAPWPPAWPAAPPAARAPDGAAPRRGRRPARAGPITVFAAASLKTDLHRARPSEFEAAAPRHQGHAQLRRLLRPRHPDQPGRPGRRLRLRRHQEHGQARPTRTWSTAPRSTSPPTCWRSPCPPANPASISLLRRPRQTGREGRWSARRRFPCGAAAETVEQATGTTLTPVSEESSVTDVLGKVTSGEADAGLVYVTDVKAAGDKVKGDPVPRVRAGREHLPDRRGAARARTRSSPPPSSTAVTGTDGPAVLGGAGFGTP